MKEKFRYLAMGALSVSFLIGCSVDPVSVDSNMDDPQPQASIYEDSKYRTTTYGGARVHIYETNPSTHGIAVSVYTNGNKRRINDMSFGDFPKARIKTKINGAFMQSRLASGTSFYGLNYDGGKVYREGKELSGPNDADLAFLNVDHAYYPSFCIRDDWSTAIRWPRHNDGTYNPDHCVPAVTKACRTIIGAGHPLVYEGKNVFTNSVKDNQGYPIYLSDNSSQDRFNHGIGDIFGANYNRPRTLLGQKQDKSFLLVIVDGSLTIKQCASLMKTLNCVNAVNMDGGGSSLMTVDGQKVTESGSVNSYYGTAIVAYPKYGDVNDDGMVNSIDYTMVKRHILDITKLTPAQAVRADVNGDRNVDSIDYTLLKRYLLEIVSKFPAD